MLAANATPICKAPHGATCSLVVSVIIVARNAEFHLPALFHCLRQQSYPRNLIELILVDGSSEDATGALLRKLPGEGWRRISQIHNPRRTLATGWNLAIRAAAGDILVRVDAHARIPPDFVEKLAAHIAAGESIVGGRIVCHPGANRLSKIIAAVESQPFGAAPARFRRPGRARYVDTVAYAAYRRQVFESVGSLNEALTRNQDNEFHARCRRAGFRLFLDPAIAITYVPRSDIRSYLSQKYLNGFWIGRAVTSRTTSCSWRHFAPLGVLTTAGIAAACDLRFALALLAAYFCTLALLFGARARGGMKTILVIRRGGASGTPCVRPWNPAWFHFATGVLESHKISRSRSLTRN